LGNLSSVERSAKRRAENEAAFREANEGLANKAAELGLGTERTPYICECESETCIEIIRLSRQEYDEVRANPKTFVVAPSHESPPDAVLYEDRGYTIIEKTGLEGELVEELDPRSATG
jgi:hypothetical protein